MVHIFSGKTNQWQGQPWEWAWVLARARKKILGLHHNRRYINIRHIQLMRLLYAYIFFRFNNSERIYRLNSQKLCRNLELI